MAKHTREQGSVSHSYLIQPELFSQYTADANVLSKALSLSPSLSFSPVHHLPLSIPPSVS